jgi:ribonuclease HII
MPSNKFSKADKVVTRQSPLLWDIPGLMAGVDEAGRGPLAGPVVAAAVILDDQNPIAGLADSKKLSAARREWLFDEIRAKSLCFSIAQASVEGLRLTPKKVLVDGNRLPVLSMMAEAIVQGDALVPAISAASILAKVHRDRWCATIDLAYPQYGFSKHKGYGTAQHLAALQMHGACPEHRKTFRPVAEVWR